MEKLEVHFLSQTTTYSQVTVRSAHVNALLSGSRVVEKSTCMHVRTVVCPHTRRNVKTNRVYSLGRLKNVRDGGFLKASNRQCLCPDYPGLHTAVDPSCVQKKRHNNVFILWPYPQRPLFIFSYSVKVCCTIEFDSEIMPYQALLSFLCPTPLVSDCETAPQFKWLMISPSVWAFFPPQSPFLQFVFASEHCVPTSVATQRAQCLVAPSFPVISVDVKSWETLPPTQGWPQGHTWRLSADFPTNSPTVRLHVYNKSRFFDFTRLVRKMVVEMLKQNCLAWEEMKCLRQKISQGHSQVISTGYSCKPVTNYEMNWTDLESYSDINCLQTLFIILFRIGVNYILIFL